MSYRSFLLCGLTCVLVACLTTAAVSQSLPSGDLIGLVTDPSGAAIPDANVKLTNNATGATQARTTTDQGTYRFSLLSPVTYTLSISRLGAALLDFRISVKFRARSLVRGRLRLSL